MEPVAALTIQKCSLTALKNIANRSADLRILDGTAPICHRRQATARIGLRGRHDYLVCIGIHDEVSIMGHDDDLPPLARLAEVRHQFVEDGFRIKILLG